MRRRLLGDQPLQLRHVRRIDTTSDREADVVVSGQTLDPQHREIPVTVARCEQRPTRFSDGVHE
jgi:hypothetical protein